MDSGLWSVAVGLGIEVANPKPQILEAPKTLRFKLIQGSSPTLSSKVKKPRTHGRPSLLYKCVYTSIRICIYGYNMHIYIYI